MSARGPMFDENGFNRGRVFAYCHDSVGVGHLARTLNICGHIGRRHPFSTFLLATGTPYVSLFEQLPRLDYIKLPAIAKEKEGAHAYHSKFLSVSTERLIRCRQTLLRHTVEQFDPDVVLVDKAPLGVCGELVPALRWLHRHRPHTPVIFGMRDIEDAPEATRTQWQTAGVPEMLEACFDEIWVYGSRSVFDVVTEYRLSKKIQKKLRFMGYIAPAPCDHAPSRAPGSGNVLVTVGGGTDGEFLLASYLQEAAARVAAMGLRSTLVGGPDLPPEVARVLRARAAGLDGVDWIDFTPCLNCLIRRAALVVSMGGYNTLCQIGGNQAPALIVPRTRPRLEQTIRAQLWAARGVVRVASRVDMTPTDLAVRVCRMLASGWKPTTRGLDFDGLEHVSARFDRFWRQEKSCATAVRL